MSEALAARISAPGPKRILSLDGGGIRGLITLGFLEKLEEILRERVARGTLKINGPLPKPEDFRLRDYYDLIGGTSTGAILAAGLGIGMSVKDLIDTYLKLGGEVFGDMSPIGGRTGGLLAVKFKTKPLAKVLKDILGERTLGSTDITTGICIVAKRYDTNSVWPMVNAPRETYYNRGKWPNKDLLLREIVRASTAAPTYFKAQDITLGAGDFSFIDGGISMHNNPAFQLFVAATLPNFGFGWDVGPQRLSIVSIGTGEWSRRVTREDWPTLPAAQAGAVIDMMMEDASANNEIFMQGLGAGTNRNIIDSNTGRLDNAPWGATLFRYERFQVQIEEKVFTDLGFPKAWLAKIPQYRKMDHIGNMQDLLDMGRRVAAARMTDDVIP